MNIKLLAALALVLLIFVPVVFSVDPVFSLYKYVRGGPCYNCGGAWMIKWE